MLLPVDSSLLSDDFYTQICIGIQTAHSSFHGHFLGVCRELLDSDQFQQEIADGELMCIKYRDSSVKTDCNWYIRKSCRPSQLEGLPIASQLYLGSSFDLIIDAFIQWQNQSYTVRCIRTFRRTTDGQHIDTVSLSQLVIAPDGSFTECLSDMARNRTDTWNIGDQL